MASEFPAVQTDAKSDYPQKVDVSSTASTFDQSVQQEVMDFLFQMLRGKGISPFFLESFNGFGACFHRPLGCCHVSNSLEEFTKHHLHDCAFRDYGKCPVEDCKMINSLHGDYGQVLSHLKEFHPDVVVTYEKSKVCKDLKLTKTDFGDCSGKMIHLCNVVLNEAGVKVDLRVLIYARLDQDKGALEMFPHVIICDDKCGFVKVTICTAQDKEHFEEPVYASEDEFFINFSSRACKIVRSFDNEVCETLSVEFEFVRFRILEGNNVPHKTKQIGGQTMTSWNNNNWKYRQNVINDLVSIDYATPPTICKYLCPFIYNYLEDKSNVVLVFEALDSDLTKLAILTTVLNKIDDTALLRKPATTAAGEVEFGLGPSLIICAPNYESCSTLQDWIVSSFSRCNFGVAIHKDKIKATQCKIFIANLDDANPFAGVWFGNIKIILIWHGEYILCGKNKDAFASSIQTMWKTSKPKIIMQYNDRPTLANEMENTKLFPTVEKLVSSFGPTKFAGIRNLNIQLKFVKDFQEKQITLKTILNEEKGKFERVWIFPKTSLTMGECSRILTTSCPDFLVSVFGKSQDDYQTVRSRMSKKLSALVTMPEFLYNADLPQPDLVVIYGIPYYEHDLRTILRVAKKKNDKGDCKIIIIQLAQEREGVAGKIESILAIVGKQN